MNYGHKRKGKAFSAMPLLFRENVLRTFAWEVFFQILTKALLVFVNQQNEAIFLDTSSASLTNIQHI